MALTSKQRSYLRKLANPLVVSVQVGKAGVTPEVTEAAAEALLAHELIKVSVLNNSVNSARETADILHERTRSELVSVVGGKITLYKRRTVNPTIEFPK
ncbi:RNA-binding protein [Clostridia bacterium]|nr:RNA-binding protein [Clostridia bacterium]